MAFLLLIDDANHFLLIDDANNKLAIDESATIGGQTIPFGNVPVQENSEFGNVQAQDTINLGDAKG